MFATLSKPYAIAGHIISDFAIATCNRAIVTYTTVSTVAIATYKTLTSQQARCVYRDAWTITRVVVQVTALALYAAGFYTMIAARKFRAYYEAEWAADVERFLSYPDRCLTEEAASEPIAEVTINADAVQPMMPAAVQTILDSNWKTTKKLRAIATHFNIHWRNARGEGKHMLNTDIKAALSDYPEILAALS